jgi:transposase
MFYVEAFPHENEKLIIKAAIGKMVFHLNYTSRTKQHKYVN